MAQVIHAALGVLHLLAGQEPTVLEISQDALYPLAWAIQKITWRSRTPGDSLQLGSRL